MPDASWQHGMQPRKHVLSPLLVVNLTTDGGSNPFRIDRDRDGSPKRPAGSVRRGRGWTRERGGDVEGLCKRWRTREGQPDGNGQGRVEVCRLICRERRGFDTSRALHCVAKGERNTVRVLASTGNKLGLRTKAAKSAVTLIFQPKMAMVGAPQLPYNRRGKFSAEIQGTYFLS